MTITPETTAAPPSIIRGMPLDEEPGIGALTLPGLLREVTTRFADKEALVMHEPGGVTRWSYAELWTRAEEVARALLAIGVGKGMRVGVMMTNRPEWLSGVFGAALAGAIPVCISTFSTPAELDYLLGASAISVLLFERTVVKKDFADILVDLVPELKSAKPGAIQNTIYPFLRHVAMVGPGAEGAIESWSDFLARGEAIPPALVAATAADAKPSDPGIMLFSSGTTNKPKGILSAHRAVCLQIWRWKRFYNIDGHPGHEVRLWSANGFFWSGNFAQALGGTFPVGGSLVLQATFVADEALKLMEQERVTLLVAWPHQWKQLVDSPDFAGTDLSSLYFVAHDSPVAQHPSVKTDWMDPRAAYGNTETFTISSIFPSGTPAERVGKSSGEPQPGNIFKIVDPLTGAVLPMGERGEIAVKGPTLMLGYIGIALSDSVDEEGFFRTGDAGWVDAENRLYWEGRLSDIIKTGGANVSPVEIDEVILTCPGVKRSQTVGVPHDTLGEIVVACIVPLAGAVLDADIIRDFAKQRLASYKVPRRVLFFREEEFATTGSNKIKAGELRKLAAARMEDA